ncbi:MAG: Rne/Rng family ribonuclease [Desulfobacteraceae bacterium]|nr:Rne/Rng family ribonuclease [Desulfobacteraceae bacterium]
MDNKILINAIDPEECRIAKVSNSILEEFHIERSAMEITHGNIYKGTVARIEPSLQAAFIDYGAEKNGFLQLNEIHSDYFHDTTPGHRSIQNLIKKNQELLVQVTKDPVMKKGAMLTTFISLPGRFIVLMPGSTTLGVSRKIEDDEERKRLKEILSALKFPEGYGAILRTAGENCNKTLISRDISYLMRLWKTIKDMVMKEKAPAMLYKERNLVLRSLRDYFTPEITEILIDNIAIYREAKEFIKIISPKHINAVKHYTGDKPIFSKYQLEQQIDSVYESRVQLKSGGSIVIEQTEALVSIDVNSGKATTKKSIEETALQTNLEAAEEIARQLRLRDLGGLIIIDFIDLRESRHNTQVEKTLKDFAKIDKAKIKLGRISKFGLMEMSRQRLRPSIEFGGYMPCEFCNGKGKRPSPESLGISFLRKLNLALAQGEVTQVKGIVPLDVANYLLNKKRRDILDLEQKRNLTISIEADSKLSPGESQIICDKPAS